VIAVVQFSDVQKATEAVIDMMNKGVGIFLWNFSKRCLLLSLSLIELVDIVPVSNQHSRNINVQVTSERFPLFQIPT
jgi:hypothetical protein